jgi:hypothetical protein
MDEFLKKNKVRCLYKYAENRRDSVTIEFGWEEADEIELSGPVVLSYYSKHKDATEDELAWAKKAKTSAVTLDDYRKYFKSLTGFEAERFLERWSEVDLEDYVDHWKSSNPMNSGNNQAVFVMNLANLIASHKKFCMYGKGYKVVFPKEDQS